MNKFDSISFVIRSNKMCPTLCSSFCSTWQSRVDRNCTGKENFPRNEFSIRNELTGEKASGKASSKGGKGGWKCWTKVCTSLPFSRDECSSCCNETVPFSLWSDLSAKKKKKKICHWFKWILRAVEVRGLGSHHCAERSIKHKSDVLGECFSFSLSKTMARHKFHKSLCCPGYYCLFSHAR